MQRSIWSYVHVCARSSSAHPIHSDKAAFKYEQRKRYQQILMAAFLQRAESEQILMF